MAPNLEEIDASAPLAGDLSEFRRRLAAGGVHGALLYLNSRTTHRFTGIYRFDGVMLRSVALVDNWDAGIEHGEDVGLADAFCSIVHDSGQPLEVLDSSSDSRFPHMTGSATASYCGVLIRGPVGEAFGALCHFDLKPCQTKTSDMPLLAAASSLLYEELTGNPA